MADKPSKRGPQERHSAVRVRAMKQFGGIGALIRTPSSWRGRHCLQGHCPSIRVTSAGAALTRRNSNRPTRFFRSWRFGSSRPRKDGSPQPSCISLAGASSPIMPPVADGRPAIGRAMLTFGAKLRRVRAIRRVL
jgi:hypothetical protein